jgi:hypothetical protein
MGGGGAAAAGDMDAVIAMHGQAGWRGLFHNGRALGLALFASLGGVLYGYNQGVFGSVQVMASFNARYQSTVSHCVTPSWGWSADQARSSKIRPPRVS